MSECEVREVWVGMEPEYITEDSEVRIYMSLVRSRRKKAWHNRKEIRKIVRQKKISDLKQMLAVFAVKLSASTIITSFAAVWAIQVAYEQRRYWAVGGEVFFIPMVFFFTYWLVGLLLEGDEGNES